MVNRFSLGLFTFIGVLMFTESGSAQPKFQYESEGIAVTIPTADERKVEQFGQQSIAAAAKYFGGRRFIVGS
jgi:hypothetical protein